jgi:hypothetical protein
MAVPVIVIGFLTNYILRPNKARNPYTMSVIFIEKSDNILNNCSASWTHRFIDEHPWCESCDYIRANSTG